MKEEDRNKGNTAIVVFPILKNRTKMTRIQKGVQAGATTRARAQTPGASKSWNRMKLVTIVEKQENSGINYW